MTNLIEIKFDIDKYIADGGKLLDLTMPLNHPLSEQWLAQWVIAQTAEDSVERAKLCARIERYGEWVGRIGEWAGHEQKVGDVLTEDDVRSIWEQTKGA
jgi:hypothetical protein